MKEWNPKIVAEMVKSNDIDNLKKYMQEYDLVLDGSRIVSKYKQEFEELTAFWDQRQHVRKFCGFYQ